MHFHKTMAAVALAAVASIAHAESPTSLGTGVGDYSFTSNSDGAWSLTLDPGTYSFTSTVSSVGFDLNDVWLSTSSGEVTDYTKNSSTQYSLLSYTLDVTKTTTYVVDVDTKLGQYTTGNYAGSVWVSAVPEPAPVAMLLAGIGLFGLMGLRRRRR